MLKDGAVTSQSPQDVSDLCPRDSYGLFVWGLSVM